MVPLLSDLYPARPTRADLAELLSLSLNDFEGRSRSLSIVVVHLPIIFCHPRSEKAQVIASCYLVPYHGPLADKCSVTVDAGHLFPTV